MICYKTREKKSNIQRKNGRKGRNIKRGMGGWGKNWKIALHTEEVCEARGKGRGIRLP